MATEQRVLPYALLVGIAVFFFFFNGIWGPFVFDDYGYIVENPTILHLHPIWNVVSPPHDHTKSQDLGWGGHLRAYVGRPLINLSFAINHALDGFRFEGFHLWNIGVHVAAALVLFGIVRRTLLSPRLRERFGSRARELAAAAALLWAVHPLQTESVTYILQRAESMAGLFYLLTLYGFLRGAEPGAPQNRAWFALSALACLAGAGCKETIVTAPVMVFLYDGIFLSPGFKEAWKRHWGAYTAFLPSWLWVGYLTFDLATHGGDDGFNRGMGVTAYFRTQCWAVGHYLRLFVWPRPLVIDYGTVQIDSWRRVWPQALTLGLLAGASAWGVWRRSPWGFLGAWFFVILAPSSSFVPIPSQTVAEHRIYLSLASLSLLVVIGGFLLLERRSGMVYWALVIALIGEFGLATIRRNWEYQDPVVLWKEAAKVFPESGRIAYNTAHSYAMEQKMDEALASFKEATEKEPQMSLAHFSYGELLQEQDRNKEALEQYQVAMTLDPTNIKTKLYAADLLNSLGRPAEAIVYCQAILAIDPSHTGAKKLMEEAEAKLKAAPHK